MNYPFETTKVNNFTFITDEPRPLCGFSRDPASAWSKPPPGDNGGFRIFKRSDDDFGLLYCFCSKCFRWLHETDVIPPHTKSFCKQAHRNPTTFCLSDGHPYMEKKSKRGQLAALLQDGVQSILLDPNITSMTKTDPSYTTTTTISGALDSVTSDFIAVSSSKLDIPMTSMSVSTKKSSMTMKSDFSLATAKMLVSKSDLAETETKSDCFAMKPSYRSMEATKMLVSKSDLAETETKSDRSAKKPATSSLNNYDHLVSGAFKKSASRKKAAYSNPNDGIKKWKSSFTIFAEDDIQPKLPAFNNVSNDNATVVISSRPIRDGRGKINMFAKSSYSISATNMKKQGVKRDRTSLANVNTNDNCGNDTDTIRSDSTEENEFRF